MRELVHRGANVNAKGEFGNTPLHLACSNNQDGVVTFLLMVCTKWLSKWSQDESSKNIGFKT